MKSPLENSPKHIELLGIITARWATMDIALLGLTAAAMRGDYNLATATYQLSAEDHGCQPVGECRN
jgi:hypothetical protein